jgi:hypothetical protein
MGEEKRNTKAPREERKEERRRKDWGIPCY